MRKIFKWLMKYKLAFFAIALVLAFGGEVISQGNEVGMRVIITSLGIDKVEAGYTVSAQIFTPQLNETKTQSKTVVSVTAPTIADAVNQVSLATGRIAIVTHCRLIVIGDSCMQESLMKVLSYFQLDGEVSWGAVIVATSGEAKKTLDGLNTLEEEAAFSWQKFLDANREFDTVTVMSLRETFNRNNDRSESFLLNIVDVKESESGGGSGGSTGGGAQSTAAESGAKPKGELKMGEKTLVIKKGMNVGELGREEIRGYSWLDDKVGKAVFSVTDIDDPAYEGSTVSVRMKKRNVGVSCLNDGGTPVLRIKIEAVFDHIENLNAEHDHLVSPEEIKKISEALERAVNRTIREQIESCVKKTKELDTDILGIENLFFRHQTKLYDVMGKGMFKQTKMDYRINSTIAI